LGDRLHCWRDLQNHQPRLPIDQYLVSGLAA
jgi:hypothetical protein